MQKSIRAGIDIGTNTALLLVAEVQQTEGGFKIIKSLADQISYVRLGQGVHSNRFFLPEAMERTLEALKKFKKICEQNQAESIVAVGTSASRDSKNAIDFYNRVKDETGIAVQIISGETEAKLSFTGGLLPHQNANQTAILDIGGGSTEFVRLFDDVPKGQSLDMGCVRGTELYLKNNPYLTAQISQMQNAFDLLWNKLDQGLQLFLKQNEWTAIAGTPTTLAALELGLNDFRADLVNGFCLNKNLVHKWFTSLSQMSSEERHLMPLLGTGRSDIMVAGIGILLSAMNYFQKESVIVSAQGLRHGILMSGYGG